MIKSNLKNYQFIRRTLNLPEGIERSKSFEAEDYLSALQSASDYWFGRSKVADYQGSQNNVVTLLDPEGDAIGTLMTD